MTTDAGQFFAVKQRDAAIRKLAREQWEREGEIEIADNAKVSEGEGNEVNGAYVAAWVWVDFAGTDLDTSDEDESDD